MAAKSQRSVAPLSNAESDREGASARARQLRCAQTVYTPHSSHRAMLAFVRYRHSFGRGALTLFTHRRRLQIPGGEEKRRFIRAAARGKTFVALEGK